MDIAEFKKWAAEHNLEPWKIARVADSWDNEDEVAYNFGEYEVEVEYSFKSEKMVITVSAYQDRDAWQETEE